MSEDPSQQPPIPYGGANYPVAQGNLAPPGEGVVAGVPVAGGYIPGQPTLVAGQPYVVGGQPMQQGMMMPGQPMQPGMMMPGQPMQPGMMIPGQPMQPGMMMPGQPMQPGMMMAAPEQQQVPGAVAPVPSTYGDAPLISQEAGNYRFLGEHQRLLVKQRFEGLEALANAIGIDIVEFKNKYDIYDANTGYPMMFAAEKSDCLCRCCCKPHHTATLEVYDVRTGVNAPIFNIDKPFKCNCCVIADCCATSQSTLSPTDVLLGKARQDMCCGGFFTPKLFVFAGSEEEQIDYNIVGPFCCVGGAVAETCCDFTFVINEGDGDEQIGRIVKMKPDGLLEGLQQFAGDKDNFLLEVSAPQTAAQIATLTGTLLLMDYIFFEGGGGAQLEDGGIDFNLCNCYCCGIIQPCNFNPTADSSDGEGGGEDRALLDEPAPEEIVEEVPEEEVVEEGVEEEVVEEDPPEEEVVEEDPPEEEEPPEEEPPEEEEPEE